MTDLTALDAAHAQMEASAGDDTARLRFYERLSDSELFVLLTEDAKDAQISPEVFDLGDASFVLVFDREERLAQFVGKPAPYAALSGRIVAQMLAGQGIGLGVNLDVAPSQMLIPPEAIAWLVDTLGNAPQEMEARAEEFMPPTGVPEALLPALDAKLATAAGLAKGAYLAAIRYEGGAQGHMLGFVGAQTGAEPALAKAVAEALTFSGLEAGSLDVSFFSLSDPAAAALSKVGLRFDLPEPERAAQTPPAAPGSDPDKPPKLR